jgi:ATPase subunit of ABC transporter with duplicated ATPase domains
MLFRAIALTLALLIGIGTIIPLGTGYAEAGPRKAKTYKKQKKYKKYSKRWWRQYRARMKRKRALQARRRAMRLRQLRMAKKNGAGNRTTKAAVAKNVTPAEEPKTALLPSGQAAPAGWRRGNSTSGEVNFSVDNGNGSASISVVGPATRSHQPDDP